MSDPDLGQKAKELPDGSESGQLAHLLLAIAAAVDAAFEEYVAWKEESDAE